MAALTEHQISATVNRRPHNDDQTQTTRRSDVRIVLASSPRTEGNSSTSTPIAPPSPGFFAVLGSSPQETQDTESPVSTVESAKAGSVEDESDGSMEEDVELPDDHEETEAPDFISDEQLVTDDDTEAKYAAAKGSVDSYMANLDQVEARAENSFVQESVSHLKTIASGLGLEAVKQFSHAFGTAHAIVGVLLAIYDAYQTCKINDINCKKLLDRSAVVTMTVQKYMLHLAAEGKLVDATQKLLNRLHAALAKVQEAIDEWSLLAAKKNGKLKELKAKIVRLVKAGDVSENFIKAEAFLDQCLHDVHMDTTFEIRQEVHEFMARQSNYQEGEEHARVQMHLRIDQLQEEYSARLDEETSKLLAEIKRLNDDIHHIHEDLKTPLSRVEAQVSALHDEIFSQTRAQDKVSSVRNNMIPWQQLEIDSSFCSRAPNGCDSYYNCTMDGDDEMTLKVIQPPNDSLLLHEAILCLIKGNAAQKRFVCARGVAMEGATVRGLLFERVGPTLHERIYTEPAPSQLQLVEWLYQIARALKELHPEFIHGDVSPYNVRLDCAGSSVKLTNFQLMTHQGKNTMANRGLLPVPVLYTAPERLRTDFPSATTSSDVYSLAVLAWEMVMRESPYLSCQHSEPAVELERLREHISHPNSNRPSLERFPSELQPLAKELPLWWSAKHVRLEVSLVCESLRRILDDLRPTTSALQRLGSFTQGNSEPVLVPTSPTRSVSLPGAAAAVGSPRAKTKAATPSSPVGPPPPPRTQGRKLKHPRKTVNLLTS